jgi:hypothetical protein
VRADSTYYDVTTSRLDEQQGRIDALDAKVATAFGFSAAMLPIFGALLALGRKDRPLSAVVAYIVAMGVYALLLWCAAQAYRVGNWSLRPDLETFRANCETYPDDEMRAWVGNECLASIAANEPRLKRKAAYVKMTLRLVAVDALVLTVAALLTIR